LPNGIRLISSHTQKTPELFLTNETQKRLNEILSLARITDAMPYMNRIQGGPAVLFIGAPGTGKSLAARHIAEKLAKPLFQLDLGKVVSKWVGETERNLSQVFEQMSGTNGCILIDEADAILGKRVSVKEGRDHYVNITVSHLLSLLEAHKGLVMLTSNLRGNLDGAYSRRFAAIVEFRRPSAELREKIWTNGLSVRVVSTDPQVIAKMAASIDLSAAEINNVITMATAIAAISEDSLSPTHIVQAIIYEKTKTSMTFTKADLHDLAPYADQIL
jgi:SpoVK/Ycf46/Vps4 family AAA+-type ATPase